MYHHEYVASAGNLLPLTGSKLQTALHHNTPLSLAPQGQPTCMTMVLLLLGRVSITFTKRHTLLRGVHDP